MKKVNKPNILFLCVDQWPGKLLGCAGHTEIETPTIDRLAASGVQFTRAYAETPICIPARRSIMTGTSLVHMAMSVSTSFTYASWYANTTTNVSKQWISSKRHW